jgi:predicted small secreted protein
MITHFRFFTLLSLTIVGVSLSACETMQGAGRDIEHAGQSIENAAD